MTTPFKPARIASFKTAAAFRAHCEAIGVELPIDDAIEVGAGNPLSQPITRIKVNGKTIGNRIAIHPMEGWDGTTTGGTSEEMKRRWRRFGASGAKLICGAEAMAVRADGRANMNQLILNSENQAGITELVDILKTEHLASWGTVDDLVIGFQLTHSGRFCRPNDKKRLEPRVAYRHPILDKKFNVTSDDQVFSDAEVAELIGCFVKAARVAHDCGADFVDIKHCHGYLLHEFLSARTRPGIYGGCFENRTRILREIIAGIRADDNPIEIGVRLSLYDMVPFRPDPALSTPGKPGPGIPEDYSHAMPYLYAFGVNPQQPTEIDLTETFAFVRLLGELGVKILNTSAGSPYYNPHIQRPAAYPPSDGYQPAHDPLIDVARQVRAVREVRARAPEELIVVSSGLSYVQDYLPHLAQNILRNSGSDAVGVGRAVLSYPSMLADAAKNGALEHKFVCRTMSDCTTAPRNGLISGCYPLDKFYTAKPEYQLLKNLKKNVDG